MVAIHTPINKGTVYTPVTKTCRVATTRGMIFTPCAWTKINDISSLHPEGRFRRVAIDAAKRFVSDMERQGLDLITPEADMLVYGPLRHRDFSIGAGAPTWRPAPGASPTFRTTGFAHHEDPEGDAEDFLLRATFLAKKVHMAEYIIKDTDA
jgi:hypothetical protein